MEPAKQIDHTAVDRALAIETSGRDGSAAIGSRGVLIASATFRSDRGHGAELLPTIAKLCADAGWSADSLEACFVSVGPGSFTGLRIGITLARTLAWSVGVRLVGVPSMEVIAANALALSAPPANLAVVLDAKRGNVYGAMMQFDGDAYNFTDGPHEIDAASWLADAPRPIAAIGDGAAEHRAALESAGATILPESLWTPRAETVLRLGQRLADARRFVEPADLLPVYIRLPSAVEKLHAAQRGEGV